MYHLLAVAVFTLVHLEAKALSYPVTGEITIDQNVKSTKVNLSNSYVSMYLYSQDGQEIDHKIIGKAKTSGVTKVSVKLTEGLQRLDFFLTDKNGLKLHNGCFGSRKLDLLLSSARVLSNKITYLCSLTPDAASIEGTVQIENADQLMDLNRHQYRMLVELAAKPLDAVSRTQLIPLGVSADLKSLPYYFSDSQLGLMKLRACLIDETNSIVRCGSFGGNSALKFLVEKGDNFQTNIILRPDIN